MVRVVWAEADDAHVVQARLDAAIRAGAPPPEA